MKKLLILMLLPILLFAEEENLRSKVEVLSSTYDYGSVSEGTVIKHDFQIKNTGNADLIIQDIVAACGCTATSTASNTVAPGATTEITAQFDTNGFSGSQVKNIKVLTNDLDNSEIILTLKGQVAADIVITPSRLFLGSVNKSKLSTLPPMKVLVNVPEGSKAQIDSVNTKSKDLEILNVQGDARQKSFQLKINPEVSFGELRQRVVVKLSGTKKNAVNIPVYVNITKDVLLRPSAVSFGLIEGEQPLKRTVKIDNFSPTPLSLSNVQVEDPSITANLKTVQEGKNYLLDLSLDPTKLESDLKTVITIETSDEQTGNISLNVYGILPPQ